MQQVTLDGLPQPKPRSRAGRPKLPAEQKPVREPKVGFYREDEEALRVLRDNGYDGSIASVLRRVLRERAEAVGQTSPEDRGRLAL